MVDLEMLKREVIANVVDERVERIILFGSHAYGTPTEDSDVDLLVVKTGIDSKIREAMAIRKAIRHIRTPKDIVVATPEEYDFYKEEVGSVIREAGSKGVVFYEKTV